ncbi:quinolinate synthetase [Alteribacillus persepolensis]|uniref:Quinolinate synthase n=1 Tax=Alteribacillus persepolensis TaxID=568899 RepID=A0A1G8AYC4_9BACI|nr:quinolinate synthase NadA [Alteribacillus persepolensis]SDH25948.1 quinolinate synthetase [Alteribacillus persepolensis]
MNVLERFQVHTLPEHIRSLSEKQMETRVREIKEELGLRLFMPGHYYQKDEVIQFADASGDSLQLAKVAAANKEAEYIVFCGVHFMAETADILSGDHQTVLLPDMRAGCSMADMADISQVEQAWDVLQETFGDTMTPLTYVNSTAAIKAFCGENEGATLTSSNARNMLKWAFQQKERILFLPDQHLGRNTAYELGIPLEQMAVWDPVNEYLEVDGHTDDVRMILWKGHCSVHEKFTMDNIHHVRSTYDDVRVIVHPECTFDVVQAADDAGSTNKIIQTIQEAPSGTTWAVGTEMNLVNRLAQEETDKHVFSLNPNMCPCLTMNRIDLPHLLWSLESILEGNPHHVIEVDEKTKKASQKALERMLHR